LDKTHLEINELKELEWKPKFSLDGRVKKTINWNKKIK
jgi:hypothetical protein